MGLVCVHMMTDYRLAAGDSLPVGDSDKIAAWFGTVPRGILICLECITGGQAWGAVLDVIKPSGTLNTFVFLVFVLYFRLIILKIVTGVFVALAKEMGKDDDNFRMLRRMEMEDKT